MEDKAIVFSKNLSKYKFVSNIRPMKVSDLKPGNKIRIAGIIMMFMEFQGNHPVFYHESNGVLVNYINKQYTKETLLTEIK